MPTTLADLPIALPMDEITALCREYQVRELSLFGSVLRDDFRDESDVDLLALFEPQAEIGFLELAGLQFALADLLGRNVDLVPKRGLKPVIRDEVLKSAQIIYAAAQPL
jgi:predicted nucleotidyltransferase